MAKMPETSVSLIRDVSGDPSCARWKELYDAYRAPMEAFLAARYPSVEADDVIQETMAALAARLPGWRYLPDSAGHFRNYLAGILKHKAADALARRKRESDARRSAGAEFHAAAQASGGDGEWRRSALEVAIAQLLADDSVAAAHRAVFRRVALARESPKSVAAAFGISRANVDQIKRRMLVRLAETVRKMTE